MALIFHSGFEMGLTGEWEDVTGAGSMTISASHPKTGAYCLRCNPSAAAVWFGKTVSAVPARFTGYVYVATAPDAQTMLFGDLGTGAASVRLTTTRYLTLYEDTTLRGTGTHQLALDTWYRVSGSCNGSGVKVFLDAVEDISYGSVITNYWSKSTPLKFYFGAELTCTTDLYFDDIVIDSTASLTDLGNIRCAVVANPNAEGTTITFDTLTPTGGTHFSHFDDPAGTAVTVMDDDFTRQAATAARRDLANLDSCADIGLAAGDVIDAVNVMIYAQGATASGVTVRHAATNYDTNNPLTTKEWYAKYYALNPAGGAWSQTDFDAFQAGAYTASHATDTYLYCLMVFVAYHTPVADISNVDSPHDFGLVATSSETATGLDHFTVTNNSSFAVTITIGGTDMTGGNTWALADDGNPGSMIVAIKAGLSGGDYTIIVKKNAPYNTLKASLAASGTQQWGMKLYAPTVFTDPVQKSGTVTLTAVAS